MILLFPNTDTLRLALTSSIVSPEVTLAPAAVSFDAQGKIYLESATALSRTTMRNLDKIGVKGSKRHASDHPEEVSCWPQVVPLVKEAGTPVVSNQAPVLFELSHADDLPTLVTEMLRLGNDRQSFRWFTSSEEANSQRVLLRVIGPPYYTLLRALDPSASGTTGTVRAYMERAPRLWTEVGYVHPLAQQIRVADGQLVLLRSPRQWTYLEETPFQDVYDVLQFKLPQSPVGWTEAPASQKIAVPLRLAAGNAADVPELWVLRENAVEQLDTLVRDADERLTQRLKFAVALDTNGNQVIVLRTIPSKLAPPALPLDNVLGFKPFWKLPNLFVPVGRRLHPTLRRDAVRRLLADDPDQVVWLYPGEGGAFTPESVPDGAFQSLEDWVDYVIEMNQQPLSAWIEATRFDFDHFMCQEPTGPKPKPDKGDRDGSREMGEEVRSPKAPPAPKGSAKSKPGGPKNAVPAEFLPEAEVQRPPSEWVKRRAELVEQFKAVEGGLDAPERQSLWPELAIANANAGDSRTEAAICWLNAMWSADPLPAAWASGWMRTEQPGWAGGIKADEFDKRLAQAPVSQEEPRATVAAFLWLAGQQPAPAWLSARLPAVQAYLERNESALPVRAVWLAAYRLCQLAGTDVLGLARVRDRLLQRLLEQGLTAERDLPMFLRVAGLKDSERLRAVNEQAMRLHEDVRKWSDHIPVNLPYIDLYFAYALAKLGESSKARKLVENARQVMEVPIPQTWQEKKPNDAVSAAVASNFLFKAFKYRVDQVLGGKPASGPLSTDLIAELETIAAKAKTSGTNNPFLTADYAIGRMRDQSRVLEPQERLDPYSYWTRNQDTLKKELADLQSVREPIRLAEQTRKLLRNGVPGKKPQEVQLLVLHEVLPLAGRVGEAFSVELLQGVPAALAAAPDNPDTPNKQAELLERALFQAGHFDRGDLVKKLVDGFSDLIHGKPEDARFKLINRVAGQCLRSLKKLGMRDEIDRFLGKLRTEVLRGGALEDLRKRYASKPDMWAGALRTLQNLATGWMTFGRHDQARPLLDEARNELLNPHAAGLPPKDYTPLAQDYATACGQCPSETGLARITELFQKMDHGRITNTWTTAPFYSRFHLNLVEAVVLAIANDDFAMGPAGRKWLDDDEYLVRRRIHADMKRVRDKAGI